MKGNDAVDGLTAELDIEFAASCLVIYLRVNFLFLLFQLEHT